MILCIDTITEFAGIALVDSKKSHVYLPFPEKKIAESIIATIEKAMKKAKAKLADLTGVMVIKGPGSFTSLRVALSVANQFAHQLKIPIVGLRTDEWWAHRTDEKSAVYLQSMNREEVYVGGRGMIPIASLKGSEKYLGQITAEHIQKLPSDFQSISKLKSIQETWLAAARLLTQKRAVHKRYALVEPFYGKEPTITKSKHHHPRRP